MRSSNNSVAKDEQLLYSNKTVYPSTQYAITNVNTFKISIFGTKNGRAPVLKFIEIWGIPSSSNSPSEINQLYKLYNGVRRKEQKECLLQTKLEVNKNYIESFEMPEEKLGRLPSDPFTGLIYTSNNQPRFNAALKARIDEFKLKNSHEIEIKNSGRTTRRLVTKRAKTSVDHRNSYTKNECTKKVKMDIASTGEKNTDDTNNCTKCKTSNSSTLYVIKFCGHYMCKPCIIHLGRWNNL